MFQVTAFSLKTISSFFLPFTCKIQQDRKNFKKMKKLLIAVIVLFTLSVTLIGQYATDSALILNEIVISADRTKIYTSSGRLINVIGKTEIEHSSVRSIGELLDKVPGLDARQRGVDGVQTDLSIRGGSFDQVLVLLNGINITDPQTGHYNLDLPLDISDVSRIEVLQGSAARLFGPNAFSGAINILTGENGNNELSVRNSVGSYGYISENISANFISGPFQTFVAVAHKESEGYIENTDFNISNLFIQSKYRSKKLGTFNIQLSTQFKEFGANSFYSSLFPDQFENTKTFFSSLGWSRKLKSIEFDAQAYWRKHNDRFELFRDYKGAEEYSWYTDHNYHMTDVSGAKFSFTDEWTAGTTSIRFDLRNEHIYSNVLGKNIDEMIPVPFEKNKYFTKEDNRFLTTISLDHQINIGNFSTSAGTGITLSEQFGPLISGGIDMGYKISERSRIFTSVNSAVRLPTYTDLYYQSATHISNPELQPEKSLTFEFGTKHERNNWSLTSTSFYRIGQNIIDWVKEPGSVKWESKNWTGINAFGSEINIGYNPDNSYLESVYLSYSYTLMDKNSDGLDSKYALDYQKNKINIDFSHKIISNLSLNWSTSFIDRAGDYADFETNQSVEYRPYILVNTKLTWEDNRFSIFMNTNNLLNKQYSDFGGLEQPGINFNLGIQIKITEI